MELTDLVRALLSGDLLTARQWVADAHRVGLRWDKCAFPVGLSGRDLVVAAALAELLASRDGATPPAWTETVAGSAEPVFLDPGLEEMPRTLAHAKAEAPEPLRKRNIFAPPGFLDQR